MCLGVPGRVVAIDGPVATVDFWGVRREVRFLMDTFDGPDGGMCIGAGNGIVSGTPLENIEAFLDESLRYGEEHRGCF